MTFHIKAIPIFNDVYLYLTILIPLTFSWGVPRSVPPPLQCLLPAQPAFPPAGGSCAAAAAAATATHTRTHCDTEWSYKMLISEVKFIKWAN